MHHHPQQDLLTEEQHLLPIVCFHRINKFVICSFISDAATESETTETSDIKQQVNEFDNNGEFEDEVDEQESLESGET